MGNSESSSGVRCGDFKSLESIAVPELVLNASALNDDPTHSASVASPAGILERAIPDVEFSATVTSVSELELDGCTPMEDSSASGPDMVVSDVGKVGSTLVSTAMVSLALENGSQAHRRHQWVKRNRFSPLSELGNELGTEFGEGED